MTQSKELRVAIVHDWLITYAGSERVLEQMLSCFPDADLFSVVDFLSKRDRVFLKERKISTSFIQSLPGARKHYRSYLPLMPLAIEQLDLSGYDLVLSSSHAVAKGVIVGPDQLHVCMCYSPMRYAWDLQHQYLAESGLDKGLKSWLTRLLLHRLRLWDIRTANGVDRFVAISRFVARRIEKTYRRESVVIYPPVDVSGFSLKEEKEDFYLAASRMVPYKKMPMLVEAFGGMPEKRLIVIGDGPDFVRCKEKAKENVQILGWQPFEVLREHMQRARAFVFAAEEDFGIAPLEAQACGTPVIGYAKGGVLETIRGLKSSSPTGVLFHKQTPEAVRDAVALFEDERVRVTATACRENALRFSTERFQREFVTYVCGELSAFRERLR